MTDFITRAQSIFGGRFHRDLPLAPLTTFRVGGVAESFVEPRTSDEVVAALALAREYGVPVTVLGGGSNVLVSDAGVKGLVVRPRGGEIRMATEGLLRADAAVTMNGLVRWTVLRGLAGIEAWAGTPGTVGGAVCGNAHFGGRQISELIEEVEVVDRAGSTRLRVPVGAMEFGYDRSRLQRSGEVLLTATFRVSPGDVAALRTTARTSLAYRRRTQPLETASAGCIFQNPQPGCDRLPEGMPWSAGALVDRAGLKGRRRGGAVVSPAHANFICNDGTATAADIYALIEDCRTGVRAHFGVELRNEVVLLGEFHGAASPGCPVASREAER